MELLLNIVWVLLGVSGLLLWMCLPGHRLASKGRFCSLLVLGCVLLLLFPVISASDDLHAMRSEIEESSVSKKIVIHDAAQSPHSSMAWGGALLAAHSNSTAPQFQVWGLVTSLPIAFPQQAARPLFNSRAPPASLS